MRLRFTALLVFIAPAAIAEPITPDYVRNNVLQSEAAIERNVEDGNYSLYQKPSVISAYSKMAQRMGLDETPPIYVNETNKMLMPQAQARFTSEGVPYIVLNHTAMLKWNAEQLKAVLGHELVHLREGHVTAENIAAAFNDPELSVANEMEADRVGAGPLGSCNPKALAKAIEIATSIDMNSYLRMHPSQTAHEYNTLVGASHPVFAERKAQLARMAAQGCS